MRPTLLLAVVGLLYLHPPHLTAQNGATQGATQNEGDIAQGKSVFRSNCAFCHGITAKGGRGPSLISAKLLNGSSDDQIKAIIQNGVPGTNMPSFENIEKGDLEALVRYIHGLAGSDVKNTPVAGDAAAGKKVYASNGCAGCHRIDNQGSVFGPELTRIGAGRSTEYIHQSIADPSADVPQEYEGVSITTADGKRITGIRINEDTFTLQLRLRNGQFANFDKTKLKAIDYPKNSLMPPYKLSAADMQNLSAYLDTLRGDLNTGSDAAKAKGIH